MRQQSKTGGGVPTEGKATGSAVSTAPPASSHSIYANIPTSPYTQTPGGWDPYKSHQMHMQQQQQYPAPFIVVQPHSIRIDGSNAIPEFDEVFVEGVGMNRQKEYLSAIRAASWSGIADVNCHVDQSFSHALRDLTVFRTTCVEEGLEWFVQLNRKSGELRIVLKPSRGVSFSPGAYGEMVEKHKGNLYGDHKFCFKLDPFVDLWYSEWCWDLKCTEQFLQKVGRYAMDREFSKEGSCVTLVVNGFSVKIPSRCVSLTGKTCMDFGKMIMEKSEGGNFDVK